MQQEQIKEQYEFLNLNGVETAQNRKPLKKLDKELLQLMLASPLFPEKQ